MSPMSPIGGCSRAASSYGHLMVILWLWSHEEPTITLSSPYHFPIGVMGCSRLQVIASLLYPV